VLHARILIEMDRLETALKALDKAIELDEECAEAHYYEGIVYERFVRFEQAMEHYDKAAQLDETNPQYRLAAAEMLIQMDRIDDAEKELQAGMTTFEHNAGFRQTLGHIAMMRDEPKKAVDLFGEACILAPADQGLMEDLARAQMEAKDFADAEYTLRRLTDGDSGGEDRRDLKFMRARCLTEIDRPVEARTLLLQLTGDSRGSQDVGAWIELGAVSLVLDEDYRLRQCAQRVIALAPHRAEGYMMMATCQHRAGKTSEAIQTLAKAMPVSDDRASLAVMQGALYYDIGREREAMAAANLALRENPADARAKELLERSSARVADVPVTE
jgi:tetratricopeptide (TPR) repeat protein